MVPELTKISHFFPHLSVSKNQTIIDKVGKALLKIGCNRTKLENDGGNKFLEFLEKIITHLEGS